MIFNQQGTGPQQQFAQPSAQPQQQVVPQAPQFQQQQFVQQPQQQSVIQQPVQQYQQQQPYPQQQQAQPEFIGYQFEEYGQENVQGQQQQQYQQQLPQQGFQQGQPNQVVPGQVPMQPQQQAAPQQGEQSISEFIDQMFNSPDNVVPQAQPQVQPQIQVPAYQAPQQIINPVVPQAPIAQPVVGQQGTATMNDIVNAMVAQTPGSTRDNIIARLEQTLGKRLDLNQAVSNQPQQNVGDPRYSQIQNELARTQQMVTQYIQQQQLAQAQVQERANAEHLRGALKSLGDKYELSRRDILTLPSVFSEYLRATQGNIPANITSINFENLFQQLYPDVRLRNASQPYMQQPQQMGQQAPQYQQQQQQGMMVVPQPMGQQAYQGPTDEQLMQQAIMQELGLQM